MYLCIYFLIILSNTKGVGIYMPEKYSIFISIYIDLFLPLTILYRQTKFSPELKQTNINIVILSNTSYAMPSFSSKGNVKTDFTSDSTLLIVHFKQYTSVTYGDSSKWLVCMRSQHVQQG